jgi:hypothetical protein
LPVSVESYVAPKAPLKCKRCQRFGHTQPKCGYPPRCVACGVAHLSGECSTLNHSLNAAAVGVNTAHYRGFLKWKEEKAELVKGQGAARAQASERCSRPTSHAETCEGGSIGRTGMPMTRLEPHLSRGTRCEGYSPNPS